MLLKAARIEELGLRDPNFGLLERPGLDSGLGFQAPGVLLKAAKIEQLTETGFACPKVWAPGAPWAGFWVGISSSRSASKGC